MTTRKNYYRISTSLAGLATGWFIALGLPEPQTPFYQPFSVRVPQGLGGEGRHGYNNAFLTWDELTREQAAIVQSLVITTEAVLGVGNGILYITMPRTDASSSGGAWIDVSGKVKMPEWRTETWSQGIIYQPATLSLNNVTVENEPSTAL